ncbi:Protein of unknown function [Gryllus bimaculatus]|nr:Protein of unknown function [Gryllus bimaculatus]
MKEVIFLHQDILSLCAADIFPPFQLGLPTENVQMQDIALKNAEFYAAAGESSSSPAAALSSAALVAAVVSALLAALLLLDVGCFACRRAGVIAALCERARHRKDAPDAPDAHAGLRIGASVKRDTSVGFDGKTTAVTRSTFVGKDSAV